MKDCMNYQSAKVEITYFEAEDIITTSVGSTEVTTADK